MLGNYYTFPELLLWIPLVTGLITIFIRNSKSVKWFVFISSLFTLTVSIISLFYSDPARYAEYFKYNNVSYVWLPYMGASFSVGLNGIGFLMTSLTAVVFPLVFLFTFKRQIEKPNGFYSLMLLLQAGLMGVFVAYDVLVFYIFWELALIPAYFLVSRWGGAKRIQASFKYFLFTLTGSVLMLVGILYIYLFTAQVEPNAAHSFSITAFYSAPLSEAQQSGLFWLFFIAFAIKIPIFPFHTWMPDTYEQAPYPVVMIMNALMVKMGIFAMIRWVLPMFPLAVMKLDDLLVILPVVGLVYASLIALTQDDLKRLAAWISIAQIGWIAAGVFSVNLPGLQGAVLQSVNHGINILGLWMVISIIERNTGTRKISELGGLAKRSPALTLFFLIILLANIGLPFTDSYKSGLLMITGIFDFSIWAGIFTCIGVVLAVFYLLRMFRKVFYGELSEACSRFTGMETTEIVALAVIVVLIIGIGIYPDYILKVSEAINKSILSR